MAEAKANHRPADPRLAQAHAEKKRQISDAEFRWQQEMGVQVQRNQILNTLARLMERLVPSMEAMAEALHVFQEPQIDAFRKRLAEQQAEEDAAAAKAGLPGEPGKDLPDVPLPPPGPGHAIVGIAKADSVEGPDGLHVVEVEPVREPPASP